MHVEHVVAFSTVAPAADYPHRQIGEAYYLPLLQELRSLPGVLSVGARDGAPMYGSLSGDRVQAPGHVVPPTLRFTVDAVMPGYYRTLGISILRGREFDEGDRLGTEPVAMIDDVAAKIIFGAENPIGRQIAWGRTATIIGVYKSTAWTIHSESRLPEMDFCLMQMPPGTFDYAWATSPNTVVVRTVAAPDALMRVIPKVVRDADFQDPSSTFAP